MCVKLLFQSHRLSDSFVSVFTCDDNGGDYEGLWVCECECLWVRMYDMRDSVPVWKSTKVNSKQHNRWGCLPQLLSFFSSFSVLLRMTPAPQWNCPTSLCPPQSSCVPEYVSSKGAFTWAWIYLWCVSLLCEVHVDMRGNRSHNHNWCKSVWARCSQFGSRWMLVQFDCSEKVIQLWINLIARSEWNMACFLVYRQNCFIDVSC